MGSRFIRFVVLVRSFLRSTFTSSDILNLHKYKHERQFGKMTAYLLCHVSVQPELNSSPGMALPQDGTCSMKVQAGPKCGTTNEAVIFPSWRLCLYLWRLRILVLVKVLLKKDLTKTTNRKCWISVIYVFLTWLTTLMRQTGTNVWMAMSSRKAHPTQLTSCKKE